MGFRVRAVFVAVAFTAVGAFACSDGERSLGCSTQAVMGVGATVIDTSTGDRVCNAVVVAKDGTYTETLPAFPVTQDAQVSCIYFGLKERAGTYTLKATRSGYAPTEQSLTVPADECHVINQRVTLGLTPE